MQVRNARKCLFQLTSSRRGWRLFISTYGSNIYFNSHPHEEDDQKSLMKSMTTLYFNSHPHEEDDGNMAAAVMSIDISTHILTKRMTENGIKIQLGMIFQLTSSRRGWLRKIVTGAWLYEFQLTSSRRGWREQQQIRFKTFHFNSHPHEEDDRSVA